jgi:8-amino-7-oxononanoate synthase
MRREAEVLHAQLAEVDREHRRRICRVTERSPRLGAVHCLVDGQQLLNFCSNDYLGLSQHPEVVAAFREAAQMHGVGSGAAHLLGGHSPGHRALEIELADFTGRERALLFSTGYMANLGIVCTFAARGETILQDRLNHASLLDGAKLSGAQLRRYAHADADAAAAQLAAQECSLLATDGVFSMDGNVAPLAALAAACRAQRTWLLVDDAHGLGVLGPEGRGSVAAAGLGAVEVPLLMGTLGKALGCFGAFVAGDGEVIELLLQRARPYLFTTALPPAVAAAARAALRRCIHDGARRERLHANIARFRHQARQLGVPLADSATAIQPLIVRDPAQALALGEALRAAGFLVGVTRPPTVPVNGSRLRITLCSEHQPTHIDALCEALSRQWRPQDAAVQV